MSLVSLEETSSVHLTHGKALGMLHMLHRMQLMQMGTQDDQKHPNSFTIVQQGWTVCLCQAHPKLSPVNCHRDV